MSLTKVYPYFRNQMDSLGFEEWRDAFNRDNIPSSIIDRSYNVQTPTISGGEISHKHQNFGVSVSVSVVYRGGVDPVEAVETAICDLELIVKSICKVSNRTSELLNVVYEGSTIEPLSGSNDNIVVLDLDFTAQVVVNPEN